MDGYLKADEALLVVEPAPLYPSTSPYSSRVYEAMVHCRYAGMSEACRSDKLLTWSDCST